MHRLILALALMSVSVVAGAQTTGPTASLDRTTVGAGETVTLNIDVADDADQAPDLAPLMQDFVVLGTSTSHNLSIINGRREAHTVLGVALRPRREGRLTIPSLVIGGQRTQPLAVEVTASGDTGTVSAEKPVVLEGKADPAQAYVGQQIDYTLRLYFAVNLADGQLADPSAEGAEIRRVGQDANYQTVRGGRRFNVVERHYAIFPQHAGALSIQPPAFQGTAVDPTDANSFFGAGTPVNAVAEPTSLQVRARPAGAGSGAWIPARELKLALDGVPPDGKGRVGQPITLTMRLDATGMPFEALPALSLPTLDGADVYPDKAVTGGSVSGPWITGRRQQGFAVVPTRPGTLHIPETTLHWWNVVADKAEVATLPARDIEVAPASGTATPAAGATPAAQNDEHAAAPVTGPVGTTTGLPWRWLFFGALALWVVTVIAWLIVRRRGSRDAVATSTAGAAPVSRERPAREAFLKVVDAGEPAAIERALLTWARTVQPSLRSPGALSSALAPGVQPVAIDDLQRARFADATLDRAALRAAFAGGFRWKSPPAGGDSQTLPPLYPR